MGTLVEAGRLAAVPPDVRESPQAAWSDMFLLVQQGAVWGDEIWAVPLGAPQLTLLYRRDLFEKFGPFAADDLGRISGAWSNSSRSATSWAESCPAGRRGLARHAGAARQAAGGPGCCWPERRPMPSTATIFRRCSTSKVSNPGGRPAVCPRARRTAWPPIAGRQTAANPAAGRTTLPQTESTSPACATAFFAGQSAMALTWPTAAGRGERST